MDLSEPCQAGVSWAGASWKNIQWAQAGPLISGLAVPGGPHPSSPAEAHSSLSPAHLMSGQVRQGGVAVCRPEMKTTWQSKPHPCKRGLAKFEARRASLAFKALVGNEGAVWPFIWELCGPFSSSLFLLLALNPGLVTSHSFCLVGLIVSYLHPHQHSSFQLPHPKLGHIPEGQIKGPQLLSSTPIRPQLRRRAHPGRLPWPFHPAVPTLGFQR